LPKYFANPSDFAFDFANDDVFTNDDRETYGYLDAEDTLDLGILKSIKFGAKFTNHERDAAGNFTTYGGFAAPILAQNMDLRAYHDGGQAVLRIIDDRAGDRAPSATILTICGMVALCGANDLGLGVAVNTLWQLPSSSEGLPVACVVRGLLTQRNLTEAARWIAKTAHASGQHYMLGDADGFASFEASGKAVRRVSWDAAAPNFIHTNHPISSEGGARHLAAEENSRGRYQMLCELAGAKTLEVAQVQSALADRSGPHPISVRPADGDDAGMMTFASIIMELKRPPAIMIAAGPPCSNPYRKIAG